jgi:hypothetical protein
MSRFGSTVVPGILEEPFGGRRGRMSTTFDVLAVSTGVVVIGSRSRSCLWCYS